jgi:hypothetical protein
LCALHQKPKLMNHHMFWKKNECTYATAQQYSTFSTRKLKESLYKSLTIDQVAFISGREALATKGLGWVS